jgi:hypothetical protein
MNVMTTVQTLPRVVVEGYLRTVRLPLNAVERVTGQQHNEQWPPALAYEGFEAGVETVLGALLKDPDLVDRGRLRRAKVAQLRKAAELQTLADHERLQADEQLDQQEARIDEERADAERRAEQRKQEFERQAAVHESKVRAKAANKTAAARRTKAAADTAIDGHERTVRTAALSEEAHALSVAKQALEADETVDVIEDTLEGTRAARQSG